MRILVTGASGFVGSHLLKELASTRHTVLATSRRSRQIPFRSRSLATVVCDLTRPSQVRKLISKARPEAVVHLAALPNVGRSWANPKALTEANLIATKNLCDALVGRNVHFLLVSSAMVYGRFASQNARLDENSPTRPISPYGISKLAGETLVRSYENDRFRVTIVRPFNHTGPRQTWDYVCPAFAERIHRTEPGGVMAVGDLRPRRDFTDVRDVVHAYRLILEKRPDENLFVLGSGKAVSIQKILDTLIRLSGKKIKTRIDRDLLQKGDLQTLVANPTRARRVLGWNLRYSLKRTLADLYAEHASAK